MTSRQAPKLKSVALPEGLMDAVDKFIEQNPSFGIKFRAEFCHFAVQHYLDYLSKAVFRDMIIKADQAGNRSAVRAMLAAAKGLGESAP